MQITPTTPHLGCVIMASGLGKRFGGNKLMADFDGQPLICRALTVTDGLFSHRVVVTRHADVASLCHAQNVPVILHDKPFRNDTIRLGLDEVTRNGDISGCLFCPGDQPLLSRETIINLIDAFLADNKKLFALPFKTLLVPLFFFQAGHFLNFFLCLREGAAVLLQKNILNGYN